MNFLGHLVVAEPTPAGRLGSVLPDLLRGPPPDFPSAVRHGMTLHLEIDRFTDAHPEFQRTCRRLEPLVGRYAGVVADVFYDHVLARDWDSWIDMPFAIFRESVYTDIAALDIELPEPAQTAVTRLRTHDWLGQYRTVEGIHLALSRLSRRSRRPLTLENATELLEHRYDRFRADFANFFPELLAFSRNWRRLQPLQDMGDNSSQTSIMRL